MRGRGVWWSGWAAGVLLVVVVLPGAAAEAAGQVRTESGVRCTKVGTAGNDVLRGTSGRDVICGRGGQDRIDGRGGNDVVDGGAGDDVLTGGAGNDSVLGGAGRDALVGSDGNDVLRGGAGGDRLSGQAGVDILSGGDGADALTGGAGSDRLLGDAGDDHVLGDAGNDTATGGAGDDSVAGGAGDDDLGGGVGADDLDGGAGFNLCDLPTDTQDVQVRCAIDEQAPVVAEVVASRPTVDVTAAAQLVTLRARVTDDTGVTRVQMGNAATRVSGTPRDGVWETTVRVPRYVEPGSRDVDVFVGDRVGRNGSGTWASVYTVLNDAVDREMPVLTSLRLSRTAVDVRSSAQALTVSARLTDDLAGADVVYLCPSRDHGSGTPRFRQAEACVSMDQVSGTSRDAVWRGTFVVSKGAPSGTWNTALWVDDAAGNSPTDFWMGPDELASQEVVDEPRYRATPHGSGVFTVQGTDQDRQPPELSGLTLPSSIDTSRGAVRVTAQIAATDAEGVTGAGLFINGYAGYPDSHSRVDEVDIAWVEDFSLVSGTPRNGVWRATFVVPGGTPDGEYFIQATVNDSGNSRSWVSPDSGWTTGNQVLTEALAPSGTRFVVRNS